jgi:hypothetical protein
VSIVSDNNNLFCALSALNCFLLYGRLLTHFVGAMSQVYGLALSMAGIIAYSVIKVREGTLVQSASPAAAARGRRD